MYQVYWSDCSKGHICAKVCNFHSTVSTLANVCGNCFIGQICTAVWNFCSTVSTQADIYESGGCLWFIPDFHTQIIMFPSKSCFYLKTNQTIRFGGIVLTHKFVQLMILSWMTETYLFSFIELFVVVFLSWSILPDQPLCVLMHSWETIFLCCRKMVHNIVLCQILSHFFHLQSRRFLFAVGNLFITLDCARISENVHVDWGSLLLRLWMYWGVDVI